MNCEWLQRCAYSSSPCYIAALTSRRRYANVCYEELELQYALSPILCNRERKQCVMEHLANMPLVPSSFFQHFLHLHNQSTTISRPDQGHGPLHLLCLCLHKTNQCDVILHPEQFSLKRGMSVQFKLSSVCFAICIGPKKCHVCSR